MDIDKSADETHFYSSVEWTQLLFQYKNAILPAYELQKIR